VVLRSEVHRSPPGIGIGTSEISAASDLDAKFGHWTAIRSSQRIWRLNGKPASGIKHLARATGLAIG